MAQSYYTAFTVQTGQVPSTQTNFPVLLLFTDNRFKSTGNGGHVAGSSGYDLRPYSDSALTAALTYELVYYSASAGTFEMWVNVASLADGGVVYIGYGDAALSSDGSSTSTWDSDFTNVYHLSDTSHLGDSTSNARTLTNDSLSNATGKINGGITGVGHTSAFSVGASRVTVSAWVYSTNFGANGMVVEKATVNTQWEIFFESGNLILRDGGSHDLSTAAPSNSNWHHVAGTIGASSAGALYKDGSSAATGSSSAFTDSSSALYLGSYDNSGYFFNGTIDEVHVSKVARSANWIATEYNNQSAPTSFWSMGTETAVGAGRATKNTRSHSLGQRTAVTWRIIH